ncbi:MAG: DUF6364 family protein [Pseudomonadota bacterium]|jgi:hypothetical protein
MPNVTISLDEKLIKAGRRYAEAHHTSLNTLVRKLLEQTVETQSKDWLEEFFSLMDRAEGNSEGQRWRREDLYDV